METYALVQELAEQGVADVSRQAWGVAGLGLTQGVRVGLRIYLSCGVVDLWSGS